MARSSNTWNYDHNCFSPKTRICHLLSSLDHRPRSADEDLDPRDRVGPSPKGVAPFSKLFRGAWRRKWSPDRLPRGRIQVVSLSLNGALDAVALSAGLPSVKRFIVRSSTLLLLKPCENPVVEVDVSAFHSRAVNPLLVHSVPNYRPVDVVRAAPKGFHSRALHSDSGCSTLGGIYRLALSDSTFGYTLGELICHLARYLRSSQLRYEGSLSRIVCSLSRYCYLFLNLWRLYCGRCRELFRMRLFVFFHALLLLASARNYESNPNYLFHFILPAAHELSSVAILNILSSPGGTRLGSGAVGTEGNTRWKSNAALSKRSQSSDASNAGIPFGSRPPSLIPGGRRSTVLFVERRPWAHRQRIYSRVLYPLPVDQGIGREPLSPRLGLAFVSTWYHRFSSDLHSLALRATVTISATFSLGDVNCLFMLVNDLGEKVMSILSALWANVWTGVAFLWRPGGSLPHARGGVGGGTVSPCQERTQGRFDSSPPRCPLFAEPKARAPRDEV